MTVWTDLITRLRNVGERHQALEAVFYEFCNESLKQISDSAFIVPGVKYDVDPEHACVTLRFAGKEVLLAFSTTHPIGAASQGVITAYQVVTHPDEKLVELDSVTFDRAGKSSLLDEDNDNIFLNTDIGAVYVAMALFAKCLST